MARWCVLVFAIGFLGCAPARDQVTLVRARDGTPVLRIAYTYLGKAPGPGFLEAHDWRRVDTDFYDSIWRNLSSHDIRFVSRRSYSRLPEEGRQVSERVYREDPSPLLSEGQWLRAGGMVHDCNEYIYDTAREANAIIYEYEVEWRGERIDFTISTEYRR